MKIKWSEQEQRNRMHIAGISQFMLTKYSFLIWLAEFATYNLTCKI